MVAHPKKLGRGESGEGRIGGLLENELFAGGAVDPVDLLLAALIAPDEGGPNHAVVGVEQGQAVHLTGEADAGDGGSRDAGFRQDAADRLEARIGPVLRALLGPKRFFDPNIFVSGGNARGDLSVAVHEQGARAACSDVDSEPIRHDLAV